MPWSSAISFCASSHTHSIYIYSCLQILAPLLFCHAPNFFDDTNTQINLCCLNFHHSQNGSTYEMPRFFFFKRKDRKVFMKYDKCLSGYWMFLQSMQNHNKYFRNYDGCRLLILKCIFIAISSGIKCCKSNLCCLQKI